MMKTLTPTQYDNARTKAMKLVEKRIGNKPERATFAREHASLFDVLDIIALLIFVAALLISSTHIVSLMSDQSASTFKPAAHGIQISEHIYTVIHQLGMIFMAELSAILFLVMYNMSKNRIFLGMAILAALFVFGANIASGLNAFIAVMPPVFTLGIGYRLETIIVEYLRRRRELDERYTAALNTYERAIEDATTHPDYLPALRAEVWRALESKNALNPDTEPAEKLSIVDVEIERHNWTGGKAKAVAAPVNFHMNGNHAEPVPVSVN